MTPAFGFSVGDFISTINLIKKVSKALKASGGASHEYQHVIIELKGLEAVLRHLEALEPAEDNIDHVNAIRGMALACQLPLRDFLAKLETFEKSMSPFINRTSLRGVHHKAKWAVSLSEEVGKLRTLTAAKVVSINLLLATHASQTLSRMEARGRTEHQSLMTEILKQKREVLRTNEKLQDIKSQASDAGADLTQRVTVVSDTVFDVQNSIQSIQSTGQQVLAFLRTFPAEMREMLRAITQTDLCIYKLLLQIHRDIANKPTNLLETNIRFEDALGRGRELPYEYFRYWEPFEGFLRDEFRNMPGEGKVANGQYRIMDSRRPDQLVTKDAWDRTVFPGVQLSMTMVLSLIKRQAGLCPRPKCTGVIVEDSSSAHVCSNCGLKLYMIIPSLEDNFGRVSVEEEEEQIEKRQVQEDVEMFGSRLVPLDIEEANDTMIVEGPANKRKRPAYSVFPSASTFQKRQRRETVTAMDWNSGATPIDAWLNQSATPAQCISATLPDSEQALQEEKARDRERDDLQIFRQVHIHSATDVPDPSAAALELDEGLEFGARLYYRNIVDRFPVIPRYLARRLAEANLVRGKRLASSKSQLDPEPYGVASKPLAESPEEQPPAYSKCFWTGGSPRRRSASVHSGFSSMNSSLRGDRMNIDPSDQSPTFQKTSFSPALRMSDKSYSGLPPPPVELGKTTRFECDICGELIRVKRRKEWQAHVFSDLSPYICTFPDCNSSCRTFTSRRAFALHEIRIHDRGLKHRCGDCGAIFKPGPQAVSHQTGCRVGPGSCYAPYAPRTLGLVCLFCGQWVEMERSENEMERWEVQMEKQENEMERWYNVEYDIHVGQHMEQIAFAVVTKPYEDWDFYTDPSSEKAAAVTAENDGSTAFFPFSEDYPRRR